MLVGAAAVGVTFSDSGADLGAELNAPLSGGFCAFPGFTAAQLAADTVSGTDSLGHPYVAIHAT